MRIDHGTWAEWEIWLEYSDGRRLPEHRCSLQAPGVGNSRYLAHVQVECQHEKDFAIMIAPPARNKWEYKASARADGGWVRGKIVRKKRHSSLRQTTRIHNQYGSTKEGAVLKTLQFSKLGTLEETTDVASSSEHLGRIDVYLEAGTAYISNKPKGAIHGNAPTTAVDEKLKKVALTSYVDGKVIKAVHPDSRGDSRRWSIGVDHSIPSIRLTFEYATRESILAQNSIADHHRAISRPRSSEDHKPTTQQRKHASEDAPLPAEGSRRKKSRVADKDTKPLIVDLSNVETPPQIITLLDSDEEP